MDNMAEETFVLAIDDNADLLLSLELMLQDEFEVKTAAGGEEGLEKLNDKIDVVFLDRRMPGMTGDELLDEMRDRGFDMPVCMVTAVDPDADIIEMPFDDYLTKPVDKQILVNKINVLTTRADFDQKSREFYRLASKKATLEARQEFNHESSPEYKELVDRMGALREEMDKSLESLIEEDPEAAFEIF